MKWKLTDPLVVEWVKEVSEPVEALNGTENEGAYDEMCFLSLAAGWAIGKGLSLEEANEFASFIRYSSPYG